jgi:REP element-mobilizing transposase RayT
MSDYWKNRDIVPKGGQTGWYSRGYLPHFDGCLPQMITFRLADSMPQYLLDQWNLELTKWQPRDADVERRRRMDAYLDRGEGDAWMKEPRVANVVQDALLHFDSERYSLAAWVVMPNHVHALATPLKGWEMGKILHSLKSFTAKECNRLLGRSGAFWQTESFDRYVRNEKHYRSVVAYIERNPVKAGLCQKPEDWLWSSARWRSLTI